jgi:hypothetical protein
LKARSCRSPDNERSREFNNLRGAADKGGGQWYKSSASGEKLIAGIGLFSHGLSKPGLHDNCLSAQSFLSDRLSASPCSYGEGGRRGGRKKRAVAPGGRSEKNGLLSLSRLRLRTRHTRAHVDTHVDTGARVHPPGGLKRTGGKRRETFTGWWAAAGRSSLASPAEICRRGSHDIGVGAGADKTVTGRPSPGNVPSASVRSQTSPKIPIRGDLLKQDASHGRRSVSTTPPRLLDSSAPRLCISLSP